MQVEEASPPAVRRVKQYKTGIDKKNKDLFVETPKGRMYTASDGVIKINLAKIIMRLVTEEEVAARKFYDGRNKLIDMECYRCLLPRSSNPKNADQHHPVFLHVGKYSGNITTHCKQYHDAVLQALARIIEETPKEEAKYKCEQYIAQLAAPVAFGGIDAWVKGASDGDVSNELLCLIWFLDANIAFVQFDNPFFRQLIKSLGGRTFPSSTTMVEKWLPALYSFAIKEMVGFLQRCRSFFTSFDGWSRFGQRFLSQSYHCIDSKAFEYWVLPLDFISCQTPHWSQGLPVVLSSVKSTGPAAWTPSPLLQEALLTVPRTCRRRASLLTAQQTRVAICLAVRITSSRPRTRFSNESRQCSRRQLRPWRRSLSRCRTRQT